MKGRSLSRRYIYLGRVKVVLGTFGAVIPATLKADTISVKAYLGDFVAHMVGVAQAWAWLATPTFLLLAAFTGFLQKRYGDPAMWSIVHNMLDDFRSKVFSDAGSDYQHHDRVTLFKHTQWAFVLTCWPWDGWLLPVERSGHTTQSSRAIFRAPDDPDHCEGMAGLAWCANGGLKVFNLPQLSSACSEEVFTCYAEKTGVTVPWLRSRLPKGRSFYAVRVESKGKPWGVIVIDSRRESINYRRVTKYWDLIGNQMGRLLERV